MASACCDAAAPSGRRHDIWRAPQDIQMPGTLYGFIRYLIVHAFEAARIIMRICTRKYLPCDKKSAQRRSASLCLLPLLSPYQISVRRSLLPPADALLAVSRHSPVFSCSHLLPSQRTSATARREKKRAIAFIIFISLLCVVVRAFSNIAVPLATTPLGQKAPANQQESTAGPSFPLSTVNANKNLEKC